MCINNIPGDPSACRVRANDQHYAKHTADNRRVISGDALKDFFRLVIHIERGIGGQPDADTQCLMPL